MSESSIDDRPRLFKADQLPASKGRRYAVLSVGATSWGSMDRYRYLVVAEAYRSWDTETRFEAMAWQRVLARNIPTIRQANAIARKAAQVIARRGLAVRTFYTPLKLLRPLGSGRLGILGPGNPELVDGDDEE